MTNSEAGRAGRCPRCKSKTRSIRKPGHGIGYDPECCNECTHSWHDAAPVASTGTPAPTWRRQESCPECNGDGCNYCFPGPVPSPSEPSGEGIYEASHPIFDPPTPSPSEPGLAEQLNSLWHQLVHAGFLCKEVISLRSQLQESEQALRVQADVNNELSKLLIERTQEIDRLKKLVEVWVGRESLGVEVEIRLVNELQAAKADLVEANGIIRDLEHELDVYVERDSRK